MNRKRKIGRNDVCPCGSGLKYKKCCLRKQTGRTGSSINDGIPAEVIQQLQEQIKRNQEWESRYEKVREPIHADFHGHKFVAVGNEIHYSPKESCRTFVDFLKQYIKRKLGEDWGTAELKKPFDERHSILKLYELTCRYEQLQVKGSNGLYGAVPSGPMKAYLLLARDLYVVQDNLALQDFMIERLKNPDQYKGARHELSAIATCFMAGCHVDFEDEMDPGRKHVEFIATHKHTGQLLAVEAKSRDRGIPIEGKVTEDFPDRLGLNRLIRSAFEKDPSEPYVIFLDFDLPPLETPLMTSKYFQDWVKTIGYIDRKQTDDGDPFSLMIMVNRPFAYADWDKPVPKHEIYGYEAENPAIKVKYPKALYDIGEAATKYCEILDFFPD